MQYRFRALGPQDISLIALFSATAFSIAFFAQFFKLIPGGGELLLTAFFFPLLIVVAVLIIGKFGTVIVGGFVFATLALPTTILTLPGAMKYPLLLPSAIATEVIFLAFGKYERLSCILAGAVMNLLVNVVFLYLFLLLGLPGADVLIALFTFYVVFSMVAGGLGGLIGYGIYKRIEKVPILRTFKGIP